MNAHQAILDQHDSLKKPFLSSITFHGAIVAAVIVYRVMGPGVEHWGDPHALEGGSVAITPVNSINIPRKDARLNPVANDTESVIPSKPEPVAKVKEPPPEPDAVPLSKKKPPPPKKKVDWSKFEQKYTPIKDRPSQVYSHTGQAAVSPMFSPAAGGGGVGSGTSSMGDRFGGYEKVLREIVARNWHSENIDKRLSTLPPVVITFQLFKDGSVRNVRVGQQSGNFMLDQSCQRAVEASAPFPPMPSGYERDSANMEIWFRLQQQ
jgi:TonB family protein